MGILILAVAICSLYLIYVSKTKKDKSKVQEAPEKIEPTTNIEIVQEVELPVKKTRKPAAKKPAAKKTKAEPAKPKKSKK